MIEGGQIGSKKLFILGRKEEGEGPESDIVAIVGFAGVANGPVLPTLNPVIEVRILARQSVFSRDPLAWNLLATR
jgi:hypothetical protein